MTHLDIGQDLVNKLPSKADVEFYDYYGIETDAYNSIKKRDDAKVLKADTPQVVEHGRIVDIAANYKHMTMEFAIRRIDRKFMVYSDHNKPIDFIRLLQGYRTCREL